MASRAARYRTGDEELDVASTTSSRRPASAAMTTWCSRCSSRPAHGSRAADRGDLKLVNSTLKELRYSFLVFEPYRELRKVVIFGSARTKHDDPAT